MDISHLQGMQLEGLTRHIIDAGRCDSREDVDGTMD